MNINFKQKTIQLHDKIVLGDLIKLCIEHNIHIEEWTLIPLYSPSLPEMLEEIQPLLVPNKNYRSFPPDTGNPYEITCKFNDPTSNVKLIER